MSIDISTVSEANSKLVNDACIMFSNKLKSDKDTATAIQAIQVLKYVLENSPQVETVQELIKVLRLTTDAMKCQVDCSTISVVSGGELFLRFITLVTEALDLRKSFEEVRRLMSERGSFFIEKLMTARPKIVKSVQKFLTSRSRILIHSHSKCVLMSLVESVKKFNTHLEIFITQSVSDGSGTKMYEVLSRHGIKSTLVLDSSVGYIMANIDFVLLGAEGVVENGGIVNKIGSYGISIIAKSFNKPVYVLCESFKFIRFFPLQQDDLPDQYRYSASTLNRLRDEPRDVLKEEHPMVDYTPPQYLTLLFTDIAILTPSAVSDELMKLYL